MGKVMLNNVAYGGALSVIETTEENYLANKEAYDASSDFISITDANSLNAEGVDYDNSDSGLESDNVQNAIDEINENLAKLREIKVKTITSTSDENGGINTGLLTSNARIVNVDCIDKIAIPLKSSLGQYWAIVYDISGLKLTAIPNRSFTIDVYYYEV